MLDDIVQGYANEVWRGLQSVPWFSVADAAHGGITATSLINRALSFLSTKQSSPDLETDCFVFLAI